MTDKHASGPVMGSREWALLVALSILWGGSFYFIKVLVAELPPLTIVLGRVALAAVILNLWLAVRRDFLPRSPKPWVEFAAMGMLNNVIPFTLIVFGETRISSGLASILNATTPMFAVLAAHLLTANEKLTAGKLVGMLAGMTGVAVLVGPAALASATASDVIGEVACLGAALSYAFAGIYGRRFRGIAPVKVATGQVTASALLLIPLTAVVDRPWTLAMPGASTWAALAAIALLCTVLAYIVYFRILAAAGATNLMLVTLLIPVTAIVLGALLLGEAMSLRECAGMAVIGAGLALIDGRLLASLSPRARALRAGP